MRATAIAICTISSAVPSALAEQCTGETQAELNVCAMANSADAVLNRSYEAGASQRPLAMARRLNHFVANGD